MAKNLLYVLIVKIFAGTYSKKFSRHVNVFDVYLTYFQYAK